MHLTCEWVGESCLVMSDSLWPHGLYSPLNSPGQDTGVSSLSLLQGIFPTQGLNPGLLPCRWILYQLSHKGSPRILQWAAYPFSRGSPRPRIQTGISCIAGRFLTTWAISEALVSNLYLCIYCFLTQLWRRINFLLLTFCFTCMEEWCSTIIIFKMCQDV